MAETLRHLWWSGPLVVLLLAGAFVLPVVFFIWTSGVNGRSQALAVVTGRPALTVAPTRQSSDGTEATSRREDRTLVMVLAGIALAVLLVVARGRRGSPARTFSSQRGEMAQAVQEAIDDIDRDPDPRHAIISAYARMECVLATHGWARRPSRAPFEYLEEALQHLAVPAAPARSLTELFEIAKFSLHRVDAAMKQRAIVALGAVRRALEGDPS